MDVATLRLAMHAMADRNTVVQDLAKRLGIATSTLSLDGQHAPRLPL